MMAAVRRAPKRTKAYCAICKEGVVFRKYRPIGDGW